MQVKKQIDNLWVDQFFLLRIMDATDKRSHATNPTLYPIVQIFSYPILKTKSKTFITAVEHNTTEINSKIYRRQSFTYFIRLLLAKFKFLRIYYARAMELYR